MIAQIKRKHHPIMLMMITMMMTMIKIIKIGGDGDLIFNKIHLIL
jgi:hypothetical protein